MQSELYLGPQGGSVDADQAARRATRTRWCSTATPTSTTTARSPREVGERVRIWVLDAGPNRARAFHVVGGQFDTVYAEGAYLLRPTAAAGGSQVLALAPAQGGFVELTFPQAGHYPFVSHLMVDAERGAHGIIEVTGH